MSMAQLQPFGLASGEGRVAAYLSPDLDEFLYHPSCRDNPAGVCPLAPVGNRIDEPVLPASESRDRRAASSATETPEGCGSSTRTSLRVEPGSTPRAATCCGHRADQDRL